MPLIAKPVLSRDSGNWIQCSWFECERIGVEMHKAVLHDHAQGLGCDHPDAKHPQYIFCSETCRQLFRHSHVELGKLPPGYRMGRYR